MFERFTDRARRVITLANQEAQRLAHDHVGTEHLLLGLVREGSGTAAVVLRDSFGIALSALRQQVEQMTHGPSPNPVPGARLTPTDRYRRVIDYAIDEAETLSNNYVGTEHLLLGLLREPEGTAARVLAGLKLNLEDVRGAVLSLLGRGPAVKNKDSLLEKAMKDLALALAEESLDSAQVRAVAEALISAGWRPQQ